MELKEKKNRITGVYISVGIHAVLFLMFFFMMAWTEPDPPIPEYGIEFNMGNEIISDAKSEDPVKAEELADVEEVKEVEEAEEVTEASEAPTQETPVEPEVTSQSEVVEETVTTEDVNSPDVVEKVEEKVVEKKEIKKVEKPEVNENKETEAKETETKTTASEPKIDNRAIFKKTDAGSGSGNKGASLDLSGWAWDFKPQPDDNSTEEGYIVFEIKVDGEGEIINIRTVEKTVSPVVERVYRDAVMELTFSKTSDNRSTASTSTGRITFIITSK
ncbi:hypothetical protein BFP72_07020 [Reichenbachiella sp. 5M10]|uniref:hypothetical protein n=1 Tax=Reichenbachiella sp. 5M10 TaxID=1889772 RepID=UPI000C147967|nr:hypothetical protein [Reichenbachiella sp. 5M10]PIB35165.1 hypothetical protein BFP72_07020 [Reichenbachiella sp. 5M10]